MPTFQAFFPRHSMRQVSGSEQSLQDLLALILPAECALSEELCDLLIRGDESAAIAALKAGADPNHLSLSGERPLHLALRSTSSDLMIRRLVAFGADLSLPNRQGLTPLALACQESFWPAACSLVDQGSPLDSRIAEARSRFGASIACAAASLDHPSCLARALSALPELGQERDLKGCDPFWHACESLSESCARLLVDFVDPSIRYFDGSSPLHMAAQLEDAGPLRQLLALGLSWMAFDERGRSPLHRAAEMSLACCQALLQAGADPLDMDKEGMTPLDLASGDRLALLSAFAERQTLTYFCPTGSFDRGDEDSSSRGKSRL